MGLPDRPVPAVETVVEALLGPGCRLTWLSGNTAMLGSGLQYMHVDTLALSTEPKTSHVVVNFSCGPYGLANGAMEPGGKARTTTPVGTAIDAPTTCSLSSTATRLWSRAVLSCRPCSPRSLWAAASCATCVRQTRPSAPPPSRCSDEARAQGRGIVASTTPATPLGRCSRGSTAMRVARATCAARVSP